MNYLTVGEKTWEELVLDPALMHMGHNCNQLPTSPDIDQAMIAAIEARQYRNYAPPHGFEELQELVRKDLGADGLAVLITNGSTDAIFQAILAFVRPRDDVLMTDPSWPHAGNFARALGAHIIEVPIYRRETDYKLTPELLRQAITPKTKLIDLVDPLNPLGSSYTAAEIRAICDIAAQRDIYVLHDSTYRDFADEHFPAARYYDRAIVTYSLSKGCGFAGLRLGALVANVKTMEQVRAAHVSRLGVSWIAQKGAIAALRHKPLWFPSIFNLQREHQRMIVESASTIGGVDPIVYPSQGNFVALDVSQSGLDPETLVRGMLEHNIIIRSGAYTSTRFGDRFVRVTTTVPTEYVQAFSRAFPKVFKVMSRS